MKQTKIKIISIALVVASLLNFVAMGVVLIVNREESFEHLLLPVQYDTDANGAYKIISATSYLPSTQMKWRNEEKEYTFSRTASQMLPAYQNYNTFLTLYPYCNEKDWECFKSAAQDTASKTLEANLPTMNKVKTIAKEALQLSEEHLSPTNGQYSIKFTCELYDWERLLGEYMVSHEQYPDTWVLPSSVHIAQRDFSAITRLTMSDDDKIECVVFFGSKYIAPLAQQQCTVYLYQPNSYDIAAYFTLNAYSTETTTENAYRLILEGGN